MTDNKLGLTSALNEMTRFEDLRNHVTQNTFMAHLSDAQKKLADSYAIGRLAEFQKYGAVGAAATQSLTASSVLADLNTRIRADQDRWAKITRRSDAVDKIRIEQPIAPIHNFSDRIVRTLKERAEQDREVQVQQFGLLDSIAKAGEKQNETMAEMIKLQGLLVKEALENSRIQRVVLYFAALSAALAIIALLK
jgi:hypothetical protein